MGLADRGLYQVDSRVRDVSTVFGLMATVSGRHGGVCKM